MKIKITRRTVFRGMGFSAGEVVDVTDDLAKELIEGKHATAIKKPKKVSDDGSRDGE